MSMNSGPFTPDSAGTVQIAVDVTTANVALFKPATTQTVMVTSAPGDSIAFIEFGTSTVVAVAATGTPILPGAIYTFTVPTSTTHVAAIGTSGTALYFTCGRGA